MLYSTNMIDLYMNKKKKGIKYSLFPLIVVIPILVLLIIFVKLKTRVLFIALGAIDLSIFSVIFIYNLLENIIKSNDLINHINSVLNGSKIEIDGVITDISKVITLKRNIHIVEVSIKSDTITYKSYFNIDLFNIDFEVDGKIKTTLSNNFIYEYEV